MTPPPYDNEPPEPPASEVESFAFDSRSGLVPRLAATPEGRRKLVRDYAAAMVVVLRRLTTWVGLMCLVFASYAWWGSEGSPMRWLLNVSLASVPVWLVLLLVERKLFRVASDAEDSQPDA